ncbi:unnamed protein product [Camellia sinensis]
MAAELLRHQHLQPYVLKVHLKLNSPRRNSLPTHWPQADYIKKTRFVEPEDIPVSMYKEKRHSCGNNRTLNPSITGDERDSSFSQRNQSIPSYLNKKIAELSVESIHEESNFGRKIISKASNFAMTSRLTPTRASPTPKKRVELSKNRVSITSSTSAQGSFTSPQGDQSIMKDKCTVQVLQRNFGQLSFGKIKLGGEDGSECSDQNVTAEASSWTSSDLLRCPFDTSSYQQRAEALEGLLEFKLAYTMEMNEKLDVYSFGVLILEVLMGKHPGDLISSLSSSPPTVYGVLLKDILDMCLPSPWNHVEEVVLLVKLALACLHTSPQCRPTMRQISVALSKQRPPLQNSLHLISLGQLFDVKCSTS